MTCPTSCAGPYGVWNYSFYCQPYTSKCPKAIQNLGQISHLGRHLWLHESMHVTWWHPKSWYFTTGYFDLHEGITNKSRICFFLFWHMVFDQSWRLQTLAHAVEVAPHIGLEKPCFGSSFETEMVVEWRGIPHIYIYIYHIYIFI